MIYVKIFVYVYIYIYAYILSKAIYKSYEMIIKYHRKKYSGPESTHQDANWRYSDLTGVDEPMGARGGSCSRHRIPFQKPCVCVCVFCLRALFFWEKNGCYFQKKSQNLTERAHSELWHISPVLATNLQWFGRTFRPQIAVHGEGRQD